MTFKGGLPPIRACTVKRARQRGDHHEGQGRDGIDADNQLDPVECSTKRRVEGAADRRGGAAADQHPQIVPAQLEAAADARGDPCAELGVARLQPDGGADPVRPGGLAGDDHAVAQRHSAAVKRVGFDRVDQIIRPEPAERQAEDA